MIRKILKSLSSLIFNIKYIPLSNNYNFYGGVAKKANSREEHDEIAKNGLEYLLSKQRKLFLKVETNDSTCFELSLLSYAIVFSNISIISKNDKVINIVKKLQKELESVCEIVINEDFKEDLLIKELFIFSFNGMSELAKYEELPTFTIKNLLDGKETIYINNKKNKVVNVGFIV
ncbi:hypothetical protein [Photobacterium leiognathi]|uniref:hypothetical protein n=1 Tax=Photobacterium leiognathi TaxID=553611 RepID=UPI002981181C|nr:hypothetical protein [Photobacterium leiognathi]